MFAAKTVHATRQPRGTHAWRRTPGIRRWGAVAVGVVLVASSCTSSSSDGQSSDGTTKPGAIPAEAFAPGTVDLPDPDVYTSKDGVLHLRVKASSTTSTINGVSYDSMMTYDTQVVDGQGTFTAGDASTYIAPRWSVLPGDRLVIDYINDLPDLAFTPVGATEAEMVPQPINLHTHGLTVDPAGNSDNVLLSIPQGRSNQFVIDIPADQYHGLYWYHPHIHGITDDQVYSGLAGLIEVGRADGDYRELDGLTMRSMMLRYNVIARGESGELIDASPYDSRGTALLPRGAMAYTTNGVVAPRLKLNAADPATGTPAESQVWSFVNVTGSASYILGLEEVDAADAVDPTVVGTPLDLTVVSVDGTPMPVPERRTGPDAARGYLLPQGGRVAMLVQGASDPSKVVRLVQVQNRSGTGDASAYDWPNQRAIPGWRDYTRDVMAVSFHDPARPGPHVATPDVLTPNYPAVMQHLEDAPIDERRTFVYDGVAPATEATPNNFPVNGGLFPTTRLDQPRAGTVEEWTILNYSSLHHPFHVHTQFGQVAEIVAPVDPAYRDPADEYPSLQYVTDLAQPEPAAHTQDVINLPPARVGPDGMPVLGADGVPAEPGRIVLRVRFQDYLGTYVQHCHRLPHEDRGMMSLVRTIPNDPVYAVTSRGDGGPTVAVHRSSDDGVVATLTPFGSATPSVSTAVGDVDGDTIPDLAVASGGAMATTVQVYSGASGYQELLATYQPFEAETTGASVAFGDVNADSRDDLVVGQGPGGRPRLVIFDAVGGGRLSDTDVYEPGFSGGVSVAAGMVDDGGRISVVTAPGAGRAPEVKVFNFDLFGDAQGTMPDRHGNLAPIEIATFDGAPAEHRGGLSVTTGYPFAAEGGVATILVSTLGGPGVLSAYRLGAPAPASPSVETAPAETAPDAHAGHGAHAGPGGHGSQDVTASGVMRPHPYEPAARRAATLRQRLDLSSVPELAAGGHVAALSNPTSATVLVAAADGGALTRWAVADLDVGLTFQGLSSLPATSVSAL